MESVPSSFPEQSGNNSDILSSSRFLGRKMIVGSIFFLAACHGMNHKQVQDVQPESDYVDYRFELPDPPAGGTQFASSVIEIPPHSEVSLCYFGTYIGPTAGVNFMTPYSSVNVTHHVLLMAVYDDSYADGDIIDCLEGGEGGMEAYTPLFDAVGFDTVGGEPFEIEPYDGMNWINLPEGVAFKLESGQRWALQLHFINTEEKPALVNSGVNIGLLPEAEVENWASTVHFHGEDFNLQPGSSDKIFDCDWQEELSVLSLMGHMHNYGTYYGIEWNRLNGEQDVIYEVDEWQGAFRDYPKLVSFEPGELTVKPGESFRTHCAWHNPTDEVLQHPTEMCTTGIVAFPLERPILCVEGVRIY